MRMKKCQSCKQVKSYDDFHRRYTRHKTTIPVTLCKTCQKVYDRKRHKIYYQKTKKYYDSHQPRIKAKTQVREAIRIGKIKKNKCKICKTLVVDAHHRDYAKPYQITWLCRKHHRRWHSRVKRRINKLSR